MPLGLGTGFYGISGNSPLFFFSTFRPVTKQANLEIWLANGTFNDVTEGGAVTTWPDSSSKVDTRHKILPTREA